MKCEEKAVMLIRARDPMCRYYVTICFHFQSDVMFHSYPDSPHHLRVVHKGIPGQWAFACQFSTALGAVDNTMSFCLSFCGFGGTVVRRRAHDPRVVCSIPALATFEDSILGQGVNTNCASLHPGV